MTLLTRADAKPLLAPPSTAEAAILRALIYADVFDFPLTVAEIQRFLDGESLTRAEVQRLLEVSSWLAERVSQVGEFYTLRGRSALASMRVNRAAHSSRLWSAARFFGRVLAYLPFVRLVAVTGALAMDNAKPGDDIDFLIVTMPGRVWLSRALVILVVRLARVAGVQLCPNYILASTALAQDRQDLFVAHELAQMTPLAGQALYWAMRAANSWATQYLPNAVGLPRSERDFAPGAWGCHLQRSLEHLLGGSLGDRLEAWEQKRKTERFQSQLRRAGSAARLDAERVQGHFNDYGHKALSTYLDRCRQYLAASDSST